MRFAAINMKSKIADVSYNMEYAKQAIEEVVTLGAEFIVLPEFFNTGFALSPGLDQAIQDTMDTTAILQTWSKEYQVILSGSYLKCDKRTKEVRNTFVIVFPDGMVYEHSKDIPTALEALYYTYGDKVRVFQTPAGRVGVAMCWEQIRYQTIRALIGNVDYVVAGSCWWDFCKEDGTSFYDKFHQVNEKMAEEAPVNMAKILGVPVIHASHFASFEGYSIGKAKSKCLRPILGHTQIIDGTGQILTSNNTNEEAPYVIADIEPGQINTEPHIPKRRYWIPDIPWKLRMAFRYSNHICHKAYKRKIEL